MSRWPALLVGIDTESDDQWSAAKRAQPTFENLYALPTLHALFRRHGVRPTYLITHPVATDARSADVLRALTEAIGDAVGERPRSYRSGRFGFSADHVQALERGGYTVESSVAPLFCEAHKGGPDFADAPLAPYFLAYDSATRAGTSQVLELPVSCGLSRDVPQALQVAWTRAPKPYTTKRVLRKLGIVRPMWLRPSYSSLDDMCALAARLAAAGEPLLNVIFHSSEIIVGGSPYNRTQAELDAFLDRLDRFLAFATRDLAATPMTMVECRDAWCAPRS